MALHAPFQHELAPQPEDPLQVVVLRYQEIYHSWSEETYAPRRAALRTALHACQEELWPLLAEPLLSHTAGCAVEWRVTCGPAIQAARRSCARWQ
jgi:hypothetical protein